MDELRREYDLLLEVRKILEQKANTVITISGVIISLLFGFTIYLSNVNNPTTGQSMADILRLTSTEVAIIIAGVVAIVVALVLSSLSLKLGRNIAMISLSGVNINGRPNLAEVDRQSKVPEVEHYRNLVVFYSSNIWQNNEFNLRKGTLILLSQIVLLSGIILVGVSLVLVYVKYLQ